MTRDKMIFLLASVNNDASVKRMLVWANDVDAARRSVVPPAPIKPEGEKVIYRTDDSFPYQDPLKVSCEQLEPTAQYIIDNEDDNLIKIKYESNDYFLSLGKPEYIKN